VRSKYNNGICINCSSALKRGQYTYEASAHALSRTPRRESLLQTECCLIVAPRGCTSQE
jgi:hypothetical protein